MTASKIALYALALKFKEAVDYSQEHPEDPEREASIEESFANLRNFFKGLHD